MQEFAEKLVAQGGLFEGAHPWLAYILVMLLCCLIVFLFVAHAAGIYSWAERRIAGRMQSRIGPNRVGPQGFAQWAVDGLKTFQKEDLIPEGADHALFKLAPYIAFVGMFGVFAALPFSSSWVVADFNVAVVYIMAIASVESIGVLMAGWASNSKWSFYGGMRSAAQIVSYEVPVALSMMAMVILAGSMNLQQIVRLQDVNPLNWNFFASPFAPLAFFTFFIAAMAEINRAPFDLPEAESELVAGYATEYSGLRFLFFFFAEWANIYVISAIAVIVFFGGWQVPFVSTEQLVAHGDALIYAALAATILGAGALGWTVAASADSPTRKVVGGERVATTVVSIALGFGPAIAALVLLWAVASNGGAAPWAHHFIANLVQMITLFVKAHVLVFLVIQARWTLPRLRIDQLMLFCWKYLAPAAFICILGNAVWAVFVGPTSPLQVATRIVIAAAWLALSMVFVFKVLKNVRTVKAQLDFKLRI